MANRGRGRRGAGWNNNQPPPVVDYQAFVKAIGVVAVTIAQASVATTTIAQASTNVG
ncbi:unnamed protein product [Ilex paraguariensis]|uniref:Uncharacterized protein n=1 Tax=Ilex paraguariensis TaxID=185542 RepID=A0ABC8UPI5_9AQUA